MTGTAGAAVLALLASIYVVTPSLGQSGNEFTGRPSVVDGDTIDIHGERFRFNGIDAPESSQQCLDRSGKAYRCGAISANALADFLAASIPTTCVVVTVDRYNRYVGDCYRNDGASVQEWMVSSGHALDWPKYSNGKYSRQQETAKRQGRGIWQGTFDTPWNWRANRRGADNGARNTNAAASRPPSGDCLIKGNISSNGHRIFHMPSQRDYGKTRISTAKGERWFCTPEEALSAGWRPASR